MSRKDYKELEKKLKQKVEQERLLRALNADLIKLMGGFWL